MLRKYLPTLPVRAWPTGVPRGVLPRALLGQLRDAVEWRNQAGHKGESQFTPEELRDVLHAVSDLLWVLDGAVGEQWAWPYVQAATRSDSQSDHT
jgi:hypothetical protein